MMPTKKSSLALLPLFMVILLDVSGVILVLPVLVPLILKTNHTLVPAGTSMILRDFLYGLSIALFPLFMFFSTPILGDLSDKFGRKKILLACLVGSSLGYALGGISIVCSSLTIFLISRALTGLFAGTQPIATAAIIDASTPEDKIKNLAWVVFTSSIGIVLGPAVGGITAEKNIISWFGYDTPFYLAAGLAFLNAIFLQFSFNDKFQPKLHQHIQLTKGFSLFISSFLEKKFRMLSLLYFCFILAWCLYYQTINWWLLEKLHYTVPKLGFFVAFIGIIFALTSGISKYILGLFKNEKNAFVFFVLIMAIANIGAAISHSEIGQWLYVILNALSNAICYTISLSIFSNLVDKESQGWIMGVTGAIAAFTWAIGGLIAGPLGYLNIATPFWTAGILCFISFFLMLIYKKD